MSEDMTRPLQSKFCSLLHDFANSPRTFQVLHSVPNPQSPSPPNPQPRTQAAKSLYVLDSSFNPPSKAHALLARNALSNDVSGTNPARFLLLLATENADKKPKPASFEDRLVMMTLLAQELRDSLNQSASDGECPAVDVAVTKKPYFADKARAIDDSGVYGSSVTQIHLIGFDTVVRIFNPKYYPADLKLGALDHFLEKHRLRVNYRLGDGGEFGSREEQDGYIRAIGDGSREAEGMRREWGRRVEMVDDAEGGEGLSSTLARRAAKERDYDGLGKFVGDGVCGYIKEMGLYGDDGDGGSGTKI